MKIPEPKPDDILAIDRSEYDRIRADISKLYDYHRALRVASKLIYGIEVNDEERQDMQMEFDHFAREYLID